MKSNRSKPTVWTYASRSYGMLDITGVDIMSNRDAAAEMRTGRRVDAGIPRPTYSRSAAPVEEPVDFMEVDDLQETFISMNHSQEPCERIMQALEREGKWDAGRAQQTRDYIACQGALGEIADRALLERTASIHATLDRDVSSMQCCDAPMVKDRNVPVLYIDEQFCIRIDVPVHRCSVCGNSVAPKPVAVGCFPAVPSAVDLLKARQSPDPPRWIAFTLLRLCDTMSITSRGRTSSHAFVKAILHQHQCNNCSEKLGFDHFRKQMDDVMQEYRIMICHVQNMSSLGVANWPAGPAAHCAACPENDRMQIHLDFCFKLRHLAKCGSQVDIEAPNRRFFVTTQEVNTNLAAAAVSSSHAAAVATPEAQGHCSDFNAAEVLGRTSEKFDVTAVGATLCRHGHLVQLMDIKTGERYVYACILLLSLMRAGVPLHTLWYDINCKFAPYFRAWIQKLAGDFAQRVEEMKFPLPEFHKYAHSGACQKRNSAVFMSQTGLMYAEFTENFWSILGSFAATTQYMTLRNRRVVLERVALSYTSSKEQSLPLLLKKMTERSDTIKGAAATAQRECLQQLAALGMTEEQAQDAVAARMTRQHELNTLAPMTDRANFARAFLEHRYVCNNVVADLPPVLVIVKGAVASQRASVTKLDKLKRELGVKAYGSTPPTSIADERLQQAVAELAQHEIQQLQLQLVQGGQEYQLLDHLISKLSGRPQEQRKVQKSKRTLEVRLKQLLEKCTTWLQGNYKGYDKLPDHLKQQKATLGDWTVDQIKRGLYPWEEQEQMHTQTSLTVSQLITKLHVMSCQDLRADEELAKLADEKRHCLALLQAQVDALDAAIEAASADGGSADAEYNAGLKLLLEAEKLKRLEIQRQAVRYFGPAAAPVVHDDGDVEDEETEVLIDLLEEEEEEEEEEEDGLLGDDALSM